MIGLGYAVDANNGLRLYVLRFFSLLLLSLLNIIDIFLQGVLHQSFQSRWNRMSIHMLYIFISDPMNYVCCCIFILDAGWLYFSFSLFIHSIHALDTGFSLAFHHFCMSCRNFFFFSFYMPVLFTSLQSHRSYLTIWRNTQETLRVLVHQEGKSVYFLCFFWTYLYCLKRFRQSRLLWSVMVENKFIQMGGKERVV